MDKFRIIYGGNNFTLDYLNAGDSHEHQCVPPPPPQAFAPLSRGLACCAAQALRLSSTPQ